MKKHFSSGSEVFDGMSGSLRTEDQISRQNSLCKNKLNITGNSLSNLYERAPLNSVLSLNLMKNELSLDTSYEKGIDKEFPPIIFDCQQINAA